ncbi:MAG: anhydro-N-acetylmuramic acid kinase [Pelagibacteraceae bacterium TMED287]|nr:MAG: anhydro-N-acetylmuramic acid kinase [Pelagibacteraceae bacterium TMED287]
MSKEFTSLGLMSGTSGDGVDASIIKSDGKSRYKVVLDKYFKYNQEIIDEIFRLKEKINIIKDLETFSKELNALEKKITLFHAVSISKIILKENIDLVGFHGQTIFHSSKDKISIQLGDGKLLNQILKKNIIYKFRQNDLRNGGEGAPLAPIFHKLLVDIKKIKLPVSILNLGGIANITSIQNQNEIFSSDIGPGNCLIDRWIKNNSNKHYDNNGEIAQSGKINKIILDQALDTFYNNDTSKIKSYDTKDFDLGFVRGLSLEDGAATLTSYTSEILSKKILAASIFVCGGGRKNKFLVQSVQEKIKGKIKFIDDLGVDGDFIESQAFAYLAIRSYLKLPISFPETTGCLKPSSGGILINC